MKTSFEELLRMDSDERQKTIMFEAAMSIEEDRIMGRGEKVYRDEFYEAPAEEYRVQLDVTNEEWGMLNDLVEAKIKHHNGLIERAQNNPSETIRSDQTIYRHQRVIGKWETIQSKMNENVW